MSHRSVLPKAVSTRAQCIATPRIATLRARGRTAAVFIAVALSMCLAAPSGSNPFAIVLAAAAETDAKQIISAKTSHERAERGDLVLVDIRHPDEWRETGVPASGHTITMHQSESSLLEKMAAVVGSDKSKPLALICAAGARSAYLQGWLRGHGFTNVMNVAEGMVGGEFGAGWLKNGLPTKVWSDAGAK